MRGPSGPGVFELVDGSFFGDTGATLGQAADLFTGIRPGAFVSDGLETFSDVFDLTSSFKSLEGFGNDLPDQTSVLPINRFNPGIDNTFGVNPGAGGGFVLYPNKPNTNMLESVYSK